MTSTWLITLNDPCPHIMLYVCMAVTITFNIDVLSGTTISMSRKGNCWDNAVAESFFGTLKTEHVNHERYKNIEEARMSLFQFIEGFYNRKRRHSHLGNISPSQFEEQAA
jgi:transposase InsO family protein